MDGLPVDVVETGQFRKFAMPNPRARHTPVQPGCSVGFAFPGNQSVMAGTLGALVRASDGRLLMLSNNHVFADEGRLAIGAPIYQQGLLDLNGGQPRQIGALHSFVPLSNGTVDVALASLLNDGLVSPEVMYIGHRPSGRAAAQLNMEVHKFGRTTSYRVGRVTSIATDVKVSYETGSYMFNDQILIEGQGGTMFSDGGDSGSLILTRGTNVAVGLLFAGSATHTLANHIDDVLNAAGVTMV